MKPTAWAAAAIACFGLAACASSPAKSSPEGDAAAHAADGPPVIKLLDAGAAPRAVLRLAPAVGPNGAVTMTMTMDLVLQIGDGDTADPAVLPPMLLGIVTNVTKVSDSGAIAYHFDIDSASVGEGSTTEASLVDAMRGQMSGLVGIGGDAEVDARAVVASMRYNMTQAVAPEVRQALEGLQQSMTQLSMPLPVEAVGIGAEWEVQTRQERNGMAIVQVAKVRLESIEGHTLKLSLHLTQSAPPQVIRAPNMPAYAMRLRSFTGAGDGTMTWDLTQVMPNRATTKFTMAMTAEIEGDGSTIPMKMGAGLNIAVEPRPSLAP